MRPLGLVGLFFIDMSRSKQASELRKAPTGLPGQRPNLLAAEDLPAEPQQARSTQARERLKTAALVLFREKGYEATSIEEIADRARVAVGGFYLHFRSKRQLLLALMDDLLEALTAVDLNLRGTRGVRLAIRDLLTRAFSRDLQFLGAYRAWLEARLKDAELMRMDREIREWTTTRVLRLFGALQRLPGARKGVDTGILAEAMDTFFWSLLAEALTRPAIELDRWIDSATHLLYHSLFHDASEKGGVK